jgi:hypothetical protein
MPPRCELIDPRHRNERPDAKYDQRAQQKQQATLEVAHFSCRKK